MLKLIKKLSPTQSQGKKAEQQARRYLEMKGYKTLHENFRTPFGEVDLVMETGNTIVFVEVRQRASRAFGSAPETVVPKKQARVAKAALTYVKSNRLEGKQLRFDIIGIGEGPVEHIENAFAPNGYYL